MANIEEVWGSAFPQKHHNMASAKSKSQPPSSRDAEREGRVYSSPQKRTAAALQRHRKTIDDLSQSLPIEEQPVEQFTVQPKRTPFAGEEFPYAPPSFQSAAYDVKLDRILRMIEQNKTGYEEPSSQDMMLYIFTGIFFLFTLDTFVTLGKKMK
jgi:hypothetical protein